MAKQDKEPLVDRADAVAKALDADVLFFNAPIERHHDQRVIELCAARRKRTNIAVLLVTEGGDADAAYRIASALQAEYSGGRFIALIPGFCKSAGTIVVLGAHEVHMSANGELGPLDVQLRDKDELLGARSGLTATAALQTLNSQAFQAFEYFLLETTRKSRGAISTKTAAEVATRMTCGLFTPIYQQVDPMYVGESGRALRIARDYGRRLALIADNLRGDMDEVLEQLITGYASHGFVIDYSEASQIFKEVRPFTAEENELARSLKAAGRWPLVDDKAWPGVFISTEKSKPKSKGKARAVNASRGTSNNGEQERSKPAPKPRAGTRAIADLAGNNQKVPQVAGDGRGVKRP